MPLTVDVRSILQPTVAQTPDRIALYFAGKAYSYQHLDKISDALAASWLEQSCQQQRIALFRSYALTVA